ncbi:hypothetical protein N7510_010304 [Penicillium lagena]|uniref:uncharacterized protein n=1 Tax=Penicillium lagena TaxID=94218 RepID=UPI0025404E93|nr:uncharacterized protein N7510_010304 [Penicillium lagena]KAJ5605150.1 hypothetical protein N7510_010304 [Penicillium lagena]
MVRVAIAGGTGKLGKTIVEVLSQNQKHNVIVLTRKPTTLPDIDAPVCVVNANDVDGLEKLLEENAIETIISTIPVATAEASAMEINLVRAASQSRPTKRFIASQWAIPVPNPRFHLPNQKYLDATIDELKTTELEWTTIYNGYFMDFFGTPHVKSNMGIFAIHIDMASKAAAIPGTGDEKISFTYTYDIAKFVDAALDLPEWQQSLFCYGDICTYNEVLKLAEKNTG